MSDDLRTDILKVLASRAAPKTSAIIYKSLPRRGRMEIEEWKAPPLPPMKSPEPRRDYALIVNGLAFAALILASLAFVGRHELSAIVQPPGAPTTAARSVPANTPNNPPLRTPIEIEAALPQTYLSHPQTVTPVLLPVLPSAATPDPAAADDEVKILDAMTIADAARTAGAVTTPVTPPWVPEVDD